MVDHQYGSGQPLDIIHIFRAPIGGLFRHVMDLAKEQIARGHRVGLIADASTGGDVAQRQLADIEPHLALGLSRVAMRREPHPSDCNALAHALWRFGQTTPDVIHGHGSKGGLYARLPGFFQASHKTIRVYTPHGGSLNYRTGDMKRRVLMAIERAMALRTDVMLFESAYIADRFRQLVGAPRGLVRIIHNGIGAQEFESVAPRADAADFIYVGELRAAKGIDTFIEALAEVGKRLGTAPRAVLVGTGPDKDSLQAQAARLGLADRIEFAGAMPARQAFERGRILMVPSRAESLPYVVIEAAGARLPMIATNVGGIPEIFGPYRDRLVVPDHVGLLAERMVEVITASDRQRSEEAEALGHYVEQHFSIQGMVDHVIDAYRDALALRPQSKVVGWPQVAVSS